MTAAPAPPDPAAAFDPASLHTVGEGPTERIASSLDAGWTSALVELRRAPLRQQAFETGPTGDQTVHVVRRGLHEIEVFRAGRWHRGTYRAGIVGLTPPHETSRLRWDAGRAGVIEAVHLFLPAATMRDAAERLRRAGQPLPEAPLSTLACDDPVAGRVAEGMLDAMAAGAPDLAAEAAAHWLALHLLHRHSGAFRGAAPARGAGRIADRRLARVVAMMRARLAEPLSLDDLAREAGVSKFHFARLFREATGEAPHRALTRLRIEAAADLLRHTDLGLDAVAAAAGFARANHFGTAFRRERGESPGAYRRRHR